jgi:hypothetical protein
MLAQAVPWRIVEEGANKMENAGSELDPGKSSWWLEGQEHCVFCGHAYVLEMECRCVDCDHPLCPGCVLEITQVRGVFCAECHAIRQRDGGENSGGEN